MSRFKLADDATKKVMAQELDKLIIASQEWQIAIDRYEQATENHGTSSSEALKAENICIEKAQRVNQIKGKIMGCADLLVEGL